ncbi:MAG: riboflavin synthase [Proteobacteria bacterium]|jgi:riboflavin synthase|nr:riboflavin synthase [Pseudomonadota bacterium]
MFTGIVATVGRITQLARRGDAMRMAIDSAGLDLSDVALGDSIAVSGPCLTVVEFGARHFAVDVSTETLARTTLGARQVGDAVNLEKALRLTDRLGGHLVSGHIDGIGTVVRRETLNDYIRWVVRVPGELAHYLAFKGSVAIDGVSLTVNGVDGDTFEVLTIPHTLERTTLGALSAGAAVNIEVDLIARYIERMLSKTQAPAGGGITLASLAEAGFGGGPTT